MPTYLNKILTGKRDGSVEVWNISTGKLKYTLLPPKSSTGSVTALQPAPAISLCAIARADGSIIIHDISADKAVIRLNYNPSRSSVIRTISFRSDGLGAGQDGQTPGIMATAGSDDGDVTFWDLNDGGRVNGVLTRAHDGRSLHQDGASGGINKVEFLPGQDVMITSGPNNSLKSWIFDSKSSSNVPRILHSRSGHSAPVTKMAFLPSSADGADTKGKWLLSAGRDQSLWGWSLRRDGQSTELSQGSINKKAKKLGGSETDPNTGHFSSIEDLRVPEITSMACSLNRDGGLGAFSGTNMIWAKSSNSKGSSDALKSAKTGWESIITGHRGDNYARTWFWGRKRAGRWAFRTLDGLEVTVRRMHMISLHILTMVVRALQLRFVERSLWLVLQAEASPCSISNPVFDGKSFRPH